MSTILFGITRSLLMFYILVNSSQTLHNKMLETILRSPILFFNRNPIGKSDTKFCSEYVLLTHYVPSYIFIFENGRDTWEKITVYVYSFSTKASLIIFPARENLNIGACKLLFQFMHV